MGFFSKELITGCNVLWTCCAIHCATDCIQQLASVGRQKSAGAAGLATCTAGTPPAPDPPEETAGTVEGGTTGWESLDAACAETGKIPGRCQPVASSTRSPVSPRRLRPRRICQCRRLVCLVLVYAPGRTRNVGAITR